VHSPLPGLKKPSETSEEVQTLQRLGLSLTQARVWLALVQLESSGAKGISQLSGLATCDVYRVVPQLLKLGLAETLVTKPKEFKATTPKEAIQILLKKKRLDDAETQRRAGKLLERVKTIRWLEPPDYSKMVLIQGGERIIQFGKPKILATKKTLDCVQTNQVFCSFVSDTNDSIEKLLARNVKMRFIIENKSAVENPSEELDKLFKNHNFKVKFAKTEIKACILLNDNKNAFISTTLDTHPSPSYWSNNPCVIAVVRGYFEKMWLESSYEMEQSQH
jgi:sugar-specific transcriptional regulator TrmB